MKMKFVTFLDYHGEQIIVFPDHIQHLAFARGVSSAACSEIEPIAGGFVVDGECVGESISLGLSSRPQDTELLKTLQGNRVERQIILEGDDDEYFNNDGAAVMRRSTLNPKALTKNQRKRLSKKK